MSDATPRPPPGATARRAILPCAPRRVGVTREQVLLAIESAILRKPSKRPLRIAIDGRSGAGKTTLADELADRLEAQARPCLRASIDDFHPPGFRQRAAGNGFTPQSFLKEGYDYASLRSLLLEPLGPNGSRRCRLDLWNSFDDVPFPEEWVDAPENAVLLVDGVFLLVPLLRPLWDFSIWLDVDWEVMLRRAAHRDPAFIASRDPIREGYRTGWIQRHTLYEQTTRAHELVDIVVDNSDVQHPYIVRARPAPRNVP
jgi:uridine kinase